MMPINRLRFGNTQPYLVASMMLLFGLVAGCEQSPTLVPASGVLKIDGEPAANITLQFLPNSFEGSEGGPTSYASTDASGRFTLETGDGQAGAVPGKHVVMLADQEEERPAQGEVATKPSRVPTRYSMVSSPLKATVVEGEEITLEITSQ